MHAIVESTSFIAANAAQHRSAVKLCNKTQKTVKEPAYVICDKFYGRLQDYSVG